MTAPEKQPAPARIRHNSELAAWFMLEHKVASRYPRVTEQIECLPMEHGKLYPHGYNGSIAEFDGKIYLAYRHHEGATLHSGLALAEIDEKGVVHHNRKIELGAGGEDPKLWVNNGKLCLSWIESTWPTAPLRSFVEYAHFEGDVLAGITRPPLPGNDGTSIQKNWIFFEAHGALFIIYRTGPIQEVYAADLDPIKTPGPRWAYGEARGGTPPLPFEGNLLRFFHSSLDNEFAQPHRRYFLGCYLMRPTPPFEVLAVSERPIVHASEIDNVKFKERPIHWKGNVVFPSGVIARDGYFLVSAGTNDSACEILKIRPNDLRLKLC